MAETRNINKLLPIKGRKVVRTQLVEILIPPNLGSPKTKYMLPDIANLRDSHIYHIKTFYGEHETSDFNPASGATMLVSPVSGNKVVSFGNLSAMFLSLQGYNGKLFQSQKPMCSFLTNRIDCVFATGFSSFATFYETNPVNYIGQKVNYPKSYIEIANPSGLSTTETQSVILEITYSNSASKERIARSKSFKNQS